MINNSLTFWLLHSVTSCSHMASSNNDTSDEEQDRQNLEEFGFQSPPPYDVSEKIREANRLLEEDVITYENVKSPRVKFKEQIVEFEIVLSDFSSDEAASADEWLTSQLKDTPDTSNNDKTMLDTDSDDGDTCLLPLEEEVKLGFPHQASYRESDQESSPEPPEQGGPSVEEKALPLVILVPRNSECSEDAYTEQFAPSSPASEDVPNSCDGFSISTDILSSKLDTESPVTELDISEEFHCSLDLNKDTHVEQHLKVTNEIFVENRSKSNKNGESANYAKRKEALKLQHYRKSIEGPISSEWNQFQTVADTPTPRGGISRSPTPAGCVRAAGDLKERPSSGSCSSKPLSTGNARVRPWTAPNCNTKLRRGMCGSRWSSSQLPSYNGMRSEYGLSKDQLDERKRIRKRIMEERREREREKKEEESQRRDENERVFRAWLLRKQTERSMESRNSERREEHRLHARLRREQADESFKLWLQRKRQERWNKQRFTIEKQMFTQHDLAYRPEEAREVFKRWLRSKHKPGKNSPKKLIFNNDPATLKKILNDVDPHTQSTFRIYLGISKLEIRHK